MKVIAVKCPMCKGTKVSYNGKTKQGTQRYICQEKTCSKKSFLLEYIYNGAKPGTEEQIIAMTANASGISDIARVMKISETTVTKVLKKQNPHSTI